MEVRFHIMQFSTEMEEALRKHDKDDRGSCDWKDMDPKILLEKLMGKVLELSDSLIDYSNADYQKTIDECADIANYSMMICDVTRRKKNE